MTRESAEPEVPVPTTCTIFINQLPRFCGHVEICRSFGRFGEIAAVYLVPGRGWVIDLSWVGSFLHSCGFVKYADVASAHGAILGMNGSLFCGSKIRTDSAPDQLPEDAQVVWVKQGFSLDVCWRSVADLDYKPAEAKRADIGSSFHASLQLLGNRSAPPPPPPRADRKKQQRMVAYEFD